MIVELKKDYILNGILKPKGTQLEVTIQKYNELKKGGYLDLPKRKVKKTVIDKFDND